MKLIGLCGILTILLICNPEAHGFILLGIIRANQAMILKLDEQITSLQNAAAHQNLVIKNQLPLLNYQFSVQMLMAQMNSTSTQLKETVRTLSAMKTSIESVSATVATNVAAIRVSTDKINIRLYDTDQKLNNAYVKHELNLSKDSMRTMCLGIAAEDHLFKHQISETDKLLKKYDQRLSTYNATVNERATINIAQLNWELAEIESTCNNDTFYEFMKQQKEEIKKIRLLLSEADNTLKKLPSRSDSLYALNNVTLDSIGRLGHDITEMKKNYLPKLTSKVLEVNNSLGATNGIIKYLNQTKTMSNKAYKDIMANFSELQQEIQAMTKKESMILQTASKIDIAHESKFREIKDLIKEKTQNLNNKLNNSITEAQPATVDNQITTLIEIANKIKSEMECLFSDIVDIYEVTVNKVPFDEK